MEAEPLAALVIVSATLLFLFIKMLVVMAGEDRDTIAAFVKERQGRLIDAKRLMFGVSLRAEEPARTYDVLFVDANAVRLQTYCTVFMSGKAAFSEVRVLGAARTSPSVPTAPPASPAEHDSVHDLAAENRRLKEELEQLRRSTPPQA